MDEMGCIEAVQHSQSETHRNKYLVTSQDVCDSIAVQISTLKTEEPLEYLRMFWIFHQAFWDYLSVYTYNDVISH